MVLDQRYLAKSSAFLCERRLLSDLNASLRQRKIISVGVMVASRNGGNTSFRQRGGGAA